jgi:hypothetical protein
MKSTHMHKEAPGRTCNQMMRRCAYSMQTLLTNQHKSTMQVRMKASICVAALNQHSRHGGRRFRIMYWPLTAGERPNPTNERLTKHTTAIYLELSSLPLSREQCQAT